MSVVLLSETSHCPNEYLKKLGAAAETATKVVLRKS
jgi:hypothetical protein